MSEAYALSPEAALDLLADRLAALRGSRAGRLVTGLAGGPGTGKSTLAAALVERLEAARPGRAALVPMDGFHMRHARLEAMGEADFKGAPHTFEAEAFVAFLARLRSAREPVSGPGYSRAIEDVVEDAFSIGPEVDMLVVEGNYLLLPDPPWSGVAPLLDLSVFVDVPRDLVERRLMRRHAEAGLFTEERNRAHVARTDLPNYDLIAATRGRADIAIRLLTAR